MFISSTVREILQKNIGRGLFAVDVGHASGTLRFCTGNRSVSISGNWYDPRPMNVPALALTTEGATARLGIADSPDEETCLESLHYQSRFSGQLMTWWFYVWDDEGGGWTEVYNYSWTVAQCIKVERKPVFEFVLSGATGTNPRAGLEVIGRTCGLTYGDALCQGTIGVYKNCDGSLAACVLRGRQASFRGAILAPEPGTEIEFYSRQSGYRVTPSGWNPPPPPGGEGSDDGGSDTARRPAGRSASDAPAELVDNFVSEGYEQPVQEATS